MSIIHTALAGGDYTALDGATAARWWLSVVNSTSTATARINQASFTYPLAQLTVNTTSGNWASVAKGMTVAVGSAAGLADRGLYRVRKAGNATTLYLGETAQGDLGLITQSIRNTGFSNTDYITVYLNRYDLWSVVPRIIAASGTIYEDYDATVGNDNKFPGPVVWVTINGGDRWAGFVDSGQTYRTVVLAASTYLWPTSASITSYAWTLPASWTVTGGSISSSTVTARVPQSAENYVAYLDVVENNGTTSRRVLNVWSHGRSGATAPLTITRFNSDSYDRNGPTMNISLYDTGLTNIPTGAMVCIWYEGFWNGGDIASATTTTVGWVTHQEEHTKEGLRQTDLDISGVNKMLEKLGAYSQWVDNNANPTTWQQLPSTLEYVDFLVWWVARQRAGNLLQLFNYQPLQMSNLTGRLPQWKVEAGGNLLAQMRKLAWSYGAYVGCNPCGDIMVRQHPNMMAYSARGALATRASLDGSMYNDVNLGRDIKPQVRRVRGEGFVWDGAATLPTPLLADAPGDAPGQGVQDERLQEQTVDNQAFLNTATGLYYAWKNNPVPSGNLSFNANWSVFYPAELQFVALATAANLRPDATALSMNIIPQSVERRHIYQANGSGVEVEIGLDILLTFEGETSGVDGVTVPVPSQVSSLPPYVPPVVSNPIPAGEIPATHNGASVLGVETTRVWASTNWGAGQSPSYTNITGTGLGGTYWALALDPYSDFLGAPQSGNLGAWLLSSTGLYYTSQILVTNPIWTSKYTPSPAATSGILRPSTTTPGVIYLIWTGGGGLNNDYVYVVRLTNYGASTAWSVQVGDNHNGNAANNLTYGADIDHYGSDEVLVTARNLGPFNDATVFRILNGTSSRLAATSLPNSGGGTNLAFIQKPLYTFGGSSNSSTGSGESFIYSGSNIVKKTVDGGTNITDITPGTFSGQVNGSVSSICAVDSANVIAMLQNTGGLFTSTNGGSSWTSRGSTIDRIIGFFPRQIGGQYALYMATATGLYFSPDFGTTIYNMTGSYVTDINNPTLFGAVIPLY